LSHRSTLREKREGACSRRRSESRIMAPSPRVRSQRDPAWPARG